MSDPVANPGRLRVAVLGLGKLGLFHSEILSQLPDAELAAVVDADPKMGARAGSIGLSAPFYESFEEMIGREEIDAAFVCTPTFLHFPLVEEASAHGVHLFVEKPFTESHDRSSELLSVVDAAGVRCAVGYVLAYHPTFRRQTDLVREGAIGRVAGLFGTAFHSEVFRPKNGWLFSRARSGGGAVINPMSHLLFLAYRAVGLPAEVSVHNATLYSEVEDLSSVRFSYATGAEGRFVCSWSVPRYPILQLRLEIEGEKGSLTADQSGLVVQLDEPHGELPAGTSRLDLSDLAAGVPFDPAFENNGVMFVAQDSAFVDGVLHDRGLATDARHAVASEYLIAAIYRSAETGGPVRVEPSGGGLGATE